MRKIIVASHGKLSQGIVDTLGVIVGNENTDAIDTYSLFPGEDVKSIVDRIESDVQSNSKKQIDYVILTDLVGGSVDNNITRLLAYSNVWVISGMNLILLLDIILSDSSKSTQSMLDSAIENGKAGIVLKSNLPIDESENTDEL